ncbi:MULTISPECIES: isoprenyl transferase [Limibacillus]|jgi:undecaprenyl diphosphate synthase|uniref:Isoprenyl transferase n=1 Tax=Limibacillus halophilus TaxID=1579333 RepID=A0A839SV29_9PROT|nr:isoprenyl transferase [Limibacillus halophilus]MBB3065879.1 undecaprenyl diphosphate synthase [Limibacillus halophilus]
MAAIEPKAPEGGTMPGHVAIIMDGNGRWAKSRGLPRSAGHRRGAEAARGCVRAAANLGIRHLTLFSFSAENWKRPLEEVDELMGLLRWYLKSEIDELHNNGVRLRVIGDRSRLATDIIKLIEEAEALTSENTRLNLMIALSYGGRQEVVAAARALAERVSAGELTPDEIDAEQFQAHLYTVDLPDPDLIIRTSGEQRISNFLIWQSAYSELVFLNTLWPDFGEADFLAAIEEYQTRERRYGASISRT